MKGENVFTQSEISQLESLIRQRCAASPNEQKGIRAKMRKLGFYGGDDFGVKDMTIEKFRELIKDGRIRVIEDNQK